MNQALQYCAICLAALVCAGCFVPRSPAPVIYHYIFEYDPPRIEAPQPLDGAIIVQPFATATAFATRRIMYRDAAFKRDAYVYHQWRALPGDMVADMLRRDLREAGLFRAVFAAGSNAPGRFMLEGMVDEVFAGETADRWEAVLSMTVTLLDETTSDTSKKILLHQTYTARAPCGRKNPQSVAAAMSSALAELSGRICADVRAAADRASSAGQ